MNWTPKDAILSKVRRCILIDRQTRTKEIANQIDDNNQPADYINCYVTAGHSDIFRS